MNKISPLKVAAKLASLKDLEAPNFAEAVAQEPRLGELLWFLQSFSLRPGSLEKFSQDFIGQFADRLGTPAMHRIGKTDANYTAAERLEIVEDIPAWIDAITTGGEKLRDPFHEKPLNLALIHRLKYADFLKICRHQADRELALELEKFCTEADAVISPAFYFHDLQGALIEMMDALAARENQKIATTAVATTIYDALEFALDEKSMVQITGDSRYGKTEAVKTWCTAHPGKARLVKTPCDASDRSFFEAIADASGLSFPLNTPVREVIARVAYILKHSGLMFIFDEAAWLLPTRFTSNTTPSRLNYIRSLALDNGCPIVLIVTPQFYDSAARKFESATGFNMAQWNGRIMRTVTLPTDLPKEDLLAVVKIHFPGLREVLARRIVAAAQLTESYLFSVEKIAKNARAVARKRGCTVIDLADLEQGIALAGITAPALNNPSAAVAPPERKNPIAIKRGRAVKPSAAAPETTVPASRETAPTLEMPDRQITPTFTPA